MIFVDTGPLYALAVSSDGHHQRTKAWFDSETSELVTTDYVVDELLTLVRSRGNEPAALKIGTAIFKGTLTHIEWVSAADVSEAWHTFRRFNDKRWSFTDCVSRVVIGRMGIPYAFAFDDHFRQFGNVTVVS